MGVNGGKNATKKNVGGVFSSQDWSQKNLSPKELLFSYASISRLYPCERDAGL